MRLSFFWCAAFFLVACSSDQDPVGQLPPCGPLGDCQTLDETLALDGLSAPVDAIRDVDGRMHIYANSVADALLAQGYLVARDRAVQMEILRRAASGRLAQVFGAFDPSLVETDIAFRHIGLRRVAEKQYAQLDPEIGAWLEAFASGVSQLFAELSSGERPIGDGVVAIEPEHFTEWSPVDSLAISRLQTWLLSYSGDKEMASTELLDALRATFTAADPDPLVQKRAGIERDLLRFEPPDKARTIEGLDAIGRGLSPSPPKPPAHPVAPVPTALLRDSDGFRHALARGRALVAPGGDFGSNNWAVGPARSQSGRAMVASDPHLSLSSPAVFWPVSLHVDTSGDALNVGGISFPGIPSIILGHNEHVGWGATVAGYDVTDVYRETLTSDGDAVVFKGSEVPLETIHEVIDLPDGTTYVYLVRIVPHHGPIVPTIVNGKVADPDPAVGALSVRWTGMEPTDELGAVGGLLRANSVDDAIEALRKFGTGAQNWMLADDAGDIGWTTHALVPYRAPAALAWNAATYEGLLPCVVLPGDGTAEWTGYWDDAAVPWAKNPPAGYLATANQDPVGGTFDNDPSNDVQPDGKSAYLGCTFADGFREGRIQERIEEAGTLSLDDMSSIQGDVRSPLGKRLVPALLLAIDSAQQEDSQPGSHPDLTSVVTDPGYDTQLVNEVRGVLLDWQTSGFIAASGIDPDDNKPLPLDDADGRSSQATLLFNAWLVRLLNRTFGDELARVGQPRGSSFDMVALVHLIESDPATLATFDPATGDSAIWDDLDSATIIETRQERMIRALVDALSWLTANAGPIADWRWGEFHTVTFEPVVPLFGSLAIPSSIDPVFRDGFPRHGDSGVVDASNFSLRRRVDEDLDFTYGSGPTQRFVAELTPGALEVRNALPGGAVWERGHPHLADQAELWRRNEVKVVPFARDQVLAARESRALLVPAQ